MCWFCMRKHLDLKKLGARGGIGYHSRVLLGKYSVASLGFAQVKWCLYIIIQGEYFVTHRFPDFFKIQKLFSSTVQGSQNKPATGSFHWLF